MFRFILKVFANEKPRSLDMTHFSAVILNNLGISFLFIVPNLSIFRNFPKLFVQSPQFCFAFTTVLCYDVCIFVYSV